jgi:hypothetical protein
MKLDACRAKKKVQQLGDNPNVFEVTYKGAHSCRITLTMVHIAAPEDGGYHPMMDNIGDYLVSAIGSLQIVSPIRSQDVSQTTMPASTSYSEWLSSRMPGEQPTCIR